LEVTGQQSIKFAGPGNRLNLICLGRWYVDGARMIRWEPIPRRLAGAAGAGLRLLAVGLAARAIAESLAPATG